jgi:hypothetical protein
MFNLTTEELMITAVIAGLILVLSLALWLAGRGR